MKACKHISEIRDCYQNHEGTSLGLQTKMVLLPNSFEIDASKIVIFKLGTHPTSRHQQLSRHVRAPTYIKDRSGFWYPYSFGSKEVSSFPNLNKSICKILIMYPIITKSCKVALTSTMCTSVHTSIQGVV